MVAYIVLIGDLLTSIVEFAVQMIAHEPAGVLGYAVYGYHHSPSGLSLPPPIDVLSIQHPNHLRTHSPT